MPEENGEPIALTIEKMKLAWEIGQRGSTSSSHNLKRLLDNFRAAYHHISDTLNGAGEEAGLPEEPDT